MKKTVSWILVADHQHACAYVHDGPGHGLKPVEGWAFATHLARSHDIVTDRPGRKPASGGAMRSMTPASDPHRAAGEKFMAGVARALSEAGDKKAFDHLVVIAPPRALGELRKALPAKTRNLVISEINEDLTKLAVADLAKRLEPVLPV